MRARCTATLSTNSLRVCCKFDEPVNLSSPLCLSNLVMRRLSATIQSSSLTSSLPVLLYSLRLNPCPLHIALLTVRTHPREIPPRTPNLHLRTVLASRLPRGIHLHHHTLLPLLPERSPTGSLRRLRDFGTFGHRRYLTHKFLSHRFSDGLRNRLFSEYVSKAFHHIFKFSTFSIPIFIYFRFRRRRPTTRDR